MRNHIKTVVAGLVGAGVATAILLVPRRLATEHPLPTPEYLSPTVRALLHQRMERHRQTAAELMQSVLVLDYVTTENMAQAIASEPTLARPLSNDATDLNAQLPGRFFELQDELKQNAKKLEDAARSRDGERVLNEFPVLVRTCVSCHQVYLRGRAK